MDRFALQACALVREDAALCCLPLRALARGGRRFQGDAALLCLLSRRFIARQRPNAGMYLRGGMISICILDSSVCRPVWSAWPAAVSAELLHLTRRCLLCHLLASLGRQPFSLPAPTKAARPGRLITRACPVPQRAQADAHRSPAGRRVCTVQGPGAQGGPHRRHF